MHVIKASKFYVLTFLVKFQIIQMNKIYYKWITITILTCFIIACRVDQDEDGIVNKMDKCPDTPIGTRVDKNGCPIELKINQIHFYIESSGSMNGYFKGRTNFINNITSILASIGSKDKELTILNTAKNINTYFISEDIEKYTGGISNYKNKIATQNIINNTSSPLDKIFNTITNTDSNDVVFLVSDCILSGTDNEIRTSNNRNFNIDKAESYLKSNIQEVFIKLKNKRYAATLLGFTSNFNGIYFDYQNSRTNLENINVKRPYYIWIIGNKDLVSKSKVDLLSILDTPPELDIDFGIIDKPIDEYHLLHAKHKTGDWEYEKNDITDINIEKNNPINFAIAIDLTKLPAYARETAYLKKYLAIESHSAKIALNEIIQNEEIDYSDLSDHFEIIKKPTILIFSLSEIKKDEIINLKLPLIYPNDYKDWSTMNDIGLENQQGKTFAFVHLVDGVRKAYENKNLNNYINISINLKK